MYGSLKISDHEHSGKLRPHEHTSYLPLLLLVLLVGIMLTILSFSKFANAATPYTGPESGSIGLTGTMPGSAPKVSAVITNPVNGQHFGSTPITVSGTCPTGTLVEIFKNNIFAGSTPCENGKFSLKIDLLIGQNILKARVYDVLNQAGPESKPVTVYYDGTLPQAAPSNFLDFTGTQLLLNTDAAYRGSFPGQALNVPITVIGGTPPFAINIDWGDSSNSVVARSDNTTFNVSHTYKKPGTYKITIQGSDSKGLVAFLTVAAIINGQPAAGVSTSTKPPSKILILWPIVAILITMVISFWLGERREKHILGVGRPQAAAFAVGAQAPAQQSST